MAVTLLVTLGIMLMLWVVGTLRRDVSLVDVYWGLGFLVVAGLSAAMNRPVNVRTAVMLALVAIWGVRLAGFLLWRKWGEPEDHRYRAMREQHGARFWWVSLFTVFLLQGLLMWVIAIPLQVVAASHANSFPSLTDLLGLSLWLIGFFFEAVGDAQLARFKSRPENRGRVMDRGLWRYTRHPNYFGEFLMWWGLFLLCVSAGGAWTGFSPLVMTVLLLKVSGVTLLESTITERRPEYAEYQRRTSSFVPRPPRR
jgi:steroid 5-alpha reductase family enzyme